MVSDMTDNKDEKLFEDFIIKFDRWNSDEKKEKLKEFIYENKFIISQSTDLENRIANSDADEKLKNYLEEAQKLIEKNRKLIKELERS